MKNLWGEALAYVDSVEYAQEIRDRFTDNVNRNPALKEHRDYVERLVYGFGERAFHWLWKLLIDEMPQSFKFLEIGVYKGQILSLVRMLADITEKDAEIWGLTLLSSFGGKDTTFPDEDYAEHIAHLHRHFALSQPQLMVGDSTKVEMQARAKAMGPYDIVFVDGCHDYEYVLSDLLIYPKLLKVGGFLVVDDSACRKKQPWGFFQGIEPVCKAVATVIETDPMWEELLCVVHDRVWRRL